MDIQVLLIPQQLKTYSPVLTIAGKVKRGLEKKNLNQKRNQAMKRPFQQLGRGGPVKATKVPIIRQPFRSAPLQITRPLPICDYCQKAGHTQQECRMANGLCLICGSGDHSIESCPHKRNGIMNQTLPAPSVPIGQRNPGPVVRRAPLPPRQ